LSAPDERSDRLVRALSLASVAIGVLLMLPIKTHVVKLDLPTSAPSHANVDWSVLLMPLGLLALLVVVPLVITRILAVTLGKAVRT
jgi:hypothetical protein